MVGREAELTALLDAFEAGERGDPRVAVVRGEAGIGKSRLVAEFRRRVAAGPAREMPTVVALGQCVESGAIGTPFTPVRRMVRDVYHAVGDATFRAATRSAVFAARLGTLLPDLAPESTVTDSVGEDAVTEALEYLIENLSREHHLVLIVEDLHWADSATLGLLKTLTATLRGQHLTVIMTYRTDDLDRTHPLRPLLADLERHRAVTGVPVGRLSDEEAMALVAELEPSTGLDERNAIVDRSQGVPFFIEELTALRGAELPDTLRSIILARYQRLSALSRAAVDLLSVGGIRVEHGAVCAVHYGDPHELDVALREAVAANVIVVEGSKYAFRHGLIQEAVHDDLLPGLRSRLHRAYAAEAQERVDAGDGSAALSAAEHWLAAGDPARAFDATLVARRHAQESFSPATAALLGERLLELWPRVGEPAARVGRGRADLAAEVAEQWADVGRQDRAVTVAQSALARPATEAERIGRARIHLALTRPLFLTGRRGEATDAALAALELLASDDDRRAVAVRARALATLRFHGVTGGIDKTTTDSGMADAIALAEASGDADTLATCQLLEAWIEDYRGEFERALDLIRAALGSAGIAQVRRLNGRLAEVETLIRLGRYEEAVRVGETGMQEASAVGRGRGHASHLAGKVAAAHLGAGHPAEALQLIRRAMQRLTSPIMTVLGGRLLTAHHVWNGDADAAAARRPPAALVAAFCAEDSEERVAWAILDAEAALVALASEPAPAEAAELAERALTATSLLDEHCVAPWAGLRRDLIIPAAWAVAEGRRSGADPALVERVSGAVEAAVGGLVDDPIRPVIVAIAAAETARGAGLDDAAAWQRAVAAVESGPAPVRYRHYARYRCAVALHARGHRGEAARLLDLISAEAAADGTAAVAGWARVLAANAGASGTNPDVLAALTPREVQVLALAAEGLTNPQIGQQLFMSAKTASVHMSAILGKLGATTRTEAAARYRALTQAEHAGG